MRSPLEQQVIGHLDRLDAAYDIIDIDPALADTADFCAHYGYALEQSANAILVASKRPQGVYRLCLGLATTRLDVNHRVKRLMGVSKLSFASAEQTIEVTGMEIGGVTPFGISDPPPILVDAAVTALDRAIIGGGSRAMKVLVDPEVFVRMPGVEVVEGLARAPE